MVIDTDKKFYRISNKIILNKGMKKPKAVPRGRKFAKHN